MDFLGQQVFRVQQRINILTLHTVLPDMINLWNKRNNSLNIMMWSNTVGVIKSIIIKARINALNNEHCMI